MDFLQPTSLTEALDIMSAHPEALPILGGTDVMVELNFDRRRPAQIVDLGRVAELDDWGAENGRLRIGAGVTYARLIADLGERLPGLAIASRTVGSPQIRNRGTVGGNLGTSSPAGDGLPPLYVSDAEVELVSSEGRRRVPVERFITGPKRNSLAPGELISAFLIPEAEGPQQYAKIGTRNAMVIAVCSVALALHPSERQVAACVGSAGPTPIRALDAERFIAGVLEEGNLWESPRALGDTALRRFGELVELAARPISDVRGTAAYRLHAVGVLGERTLKWAWNDYCGGSR
ncbi:MAG: FAD binding domain-containing protein [Solirubrobacterales bacterium]|nr:FAD binding domain-containing protein [Solirubrobacterales bacterium]MBV9363485.1 FAD binding domain-containing protein [Solirubrobacterales bacterium]